MRTQVGIVGAGPAGLMLSHLLHRSGIQSIVLESRSRAYVEQRVRAGVLEQWAADLLVETGVGGRLQREAMRHDGIFLCFDGALHHLDFRNLVGKGIAIYGQQEIVRDLIARRLEDGLRPAWSPSGALPATPVRPVRRSHHTNSRTAFGMTDTSTTRRRPTG